MSDFRSNCYGFVYAGLQNSDEEFFKDIDDLPLKKVELKGKIDKEIISTSDAIKEVFFQENSGEWKVLELLDGGKRSQHVAFFNATGDFYDQNGPDGEIRLGGNLDDLLYQYQELFGTAYYQVHPLNPEQEEQVSNFMDHLSD